MTLRERLHPVITWCLVLCIWPILVICAWLGGELDEVDEE